MHNLLKYMKGKWYVICLFAILGAIALGIEKSYVPSIPQTGEMVFLREVKIDPIPTFYAGNTGTEIQFDYVMKSWTVRHKLLTEFNDKFEMERLDRNWKNLKDKEKIGWMDSHFGIAYVMPGTYELVISFDKTDPKDAEYILANKDDFIQTYKDAMAEELKNIDKNVSMSEVYNSNLIQSLNISTKRILAKYIFIGTVLGGLLGTAVVSLLYIRNCQGKTK